jgi:hypothetical protein
MLSGLKYFLIIINTTACFSCVALAFHFIVIPSGAKIIYAEEYKEKMFVCDSAMRNHLIAKNRVKFEKTRQALKKLEISEVGLVHCHDYDVLRKKMINMGLSSNDLAMLGLEAIEAKAADIKKLVEIHEFKY